MRQWIFGSFAGWLLRKQLNILLDLSVFLTRTTKSLFRLLSGGRLTWGSGKAVATGKSEADEAKREAGCKQVVLEFASALGYIAREAMNKKELEDKISDSSDAGCQRAFMDSSS